MQKKNKLQLVKYFSLSDFTLKHSTNSDGKSHFYYLDTDKYLDETEYQLLSSQQDIHNFTIDYTDQDSGSYTKILYAGGQIQLPSDCLTTPKVKIDYSKLNYLISEFPNYESMQEFINERINDDFIIKSSDPLTKVVEMSRKTLIKTKVKD